MIDYKLGSNLGKKDIIPILLRHLGFNNKLIYSPFINKILCFFISNFGIPSMRTRVNMIREMINPIDSHNFTFSKLLESKPNIFLELGSSIGLWSFALENHTNSSGVIIDVDRKDISTSRKISKKLDSKIVAVSKDVFDLDLPNNFFDLIYSVEFLDHVDNLETLLQKCYASLSPKGQFIFQVPYHFREAHTREVVSTGHEFDFKINGFCEETFEKYNMGLFSFKYYKVGRRNQFFDPCNVCDIKNKSFHPLKLVGVGRKT